MDYRWSILRVSKEELTFPYIFFGFIVFFSYFCRQNPHYLLLKMKRQRIAIGSILQIPVEDYYCYAQILGKANYAFFDYKSSSPSIIF